MGKSPDERVTRMEPRNRGNTYRLFAGVMRKATSNESQISYALFILRLRVTAKPVRIDRTYGALG